VPRPDPVPRPTADQKLRLKRGFRLLGWFSALIAAIAVLLVARGQNALHLHMLIATAFGIGLTVFIGGALMLLIFYSAASGHDEAASHYDPEDDR
jgi:Mn2+/Fe2+ NRAMP family transporter